MSLNKNLNFINDIKDCLSFADTSLDEYDILNLQDCFIKKGVSFLSFKNIALGRKIIQKILVSIKSYKNIGCVVENDVGINKGYFNILQFFLRDKKIVNKNKFKLNNILDRIYFDFIWIEMSEKIRLFFDENSINEFLLKKYEYPVLIVII